MSTDFDWSAAEEQMHDAQRVLSLRERAQDAFEAAQAQHRVDLLLAAAETLESVLGESNGTHPEVELAPGGAGHVFVTVDNIRFRVVVDHDKDGDVRTALTVRTSSGTWLVVQDMADLGGKLKRDPCFAEDLVEPGLVVPDKRYLTNGRCVVEMITDGKPNKNYGLRRGASPDLLVKDIHDGQSYLILPMQRHLWKECDAHGLVF